VRSISVLKGFVVYRLASPSIPQSRGTSVKPTCHQASHMERSSVAYDIHGLTPATNRLAASALAGVESGRSSRAPGCSNHPRLPKLSISSTGSTRPHKHDVCVHPRLGIGRQMRPVVLELRENAHALTGSPSKVRHFHDRLATSQVSSATTWSNSSTAFRRDADVRELLLQIGDLLGEGRNSSSLRSIRPADGPLSHSALVSSGYCLRPPEVAEPDPLQQVLVLLHPVDAQADEAVLTLVLADGAQVLVARPRLGRRVLH